MFKVDRDMSNITVTCIGHRWKVSAFWWICNTQTPEKKKNYAGRLELTKRQMQNIKMPQKLK
jgi:hypothetical protein